MNGRVTGMRRHASRLENQSAVGLVREKVYDAIAGQYPWLSDECARQVERRRYEF